MFKISLDIKPDLNSDRVKLSHIFVKPLNLSFNEGYQPIKALLQTFWHVKTIYNLKCLMEWSWQVQKSCCFPGGGGGVLWIFLGRGVPLGL